MKRASPGRVPKARKRQPVAVARAAAFRWKRRQRKQFGFAIGEEKQL